MRKALVFTLLVSTVYLAPATSAYAEFPPPPPGDGFDDPGDPFLDPDDDSGDLEPDEDLPSDSTSTLDFFSNVSESCSGVRSKKTQKACKEFFKNAKKMLRAFDAEDLFLSDDPEDESDNVLEVINDY